MKNPSVTEFQLAAEEFCGIAASDSPVTKCDLWTLRELLLRLIFHIPAVEDRQHSADFDGNRMDDKECGRAQERFSGLPFNFYRVVFDPHDFDGGNEPVTAMLADDLADIYRDLAQGLDNAKQGHLNDACFEWAQSYGFHWARHAVNALAALEIYRIDTNERVEHISGGNGG